MGILQGGRLSFLPPGNFPTQGSSPHLFTSLSPALAGRFFTTWVRKGMGFHPGKGTATHSSILAWRIPGQRGLVSYSPWGRKESDTTEQPTLASLGPPRRPLNATEDPKRRLGINKELPYSWMERPSITKISILPEVTEGLPGGLDSKESDCQRGRLGFPPWVGRIPWSKKTDELGCKERKKVTSLSRVQLFVTPWTVAYQASPSMGFSRQEYWSGLPFPSPGDLPHPGTEPGSPAL